MKQRVLIFTMLSFIGSFAIGGAMIAFPRLQANYTLFAILCMFAPALASVLTRAMTKEGFKDMYLRPRFKRNWGAYALAVLLPAALTVVSAALYFLLFPQHFDANFSLIGLAAASVGLSPLALLAAQLLQAVLLSPLINVIPAMGEELGWRGYLLPRLRSFMSSGAAIVVSGVIWGLWHAPLIYLGHNYGVGYGGYPWLGFLAMTVFCVAFGSFLSYLTFKTRSAWPAAIAHAAFNGVAGIAALVTKGAPNPLLGPLPVGLIGGAGIIVAGVLFFALAQRLPHDQAAETE